MSAQLPSFPSETTTMLANMSSQRNKLANISFILSLYAPIVLLLTVVSIVAHLLFAIAILFALALLALPAIVAAVVTGHVAVSQTTHSAPDRANRGFAIAALVLGYIQLGGLFFLAVVEQVLRFHAR